MAQRKSPVEKLKEFLDFHAATHSAVLSNFPLKWEKYGDLVIFDRKLIEQSEWLTLPPEFWEKICTILLCNRLAVKGVILQDGFRTPDVTMIVGTDPWALFKDNGIFYTWNVQKNMFCAGNAPERHRVAKLDCRGAVIADLFAGIGYFTIPYLVHAKAAFVYACEWNPEAVVALKRNLSLNKVEKQCQIYEVDNREAGLNGIADRVNLGLIPSSESSWQAACRALKPSGGVLSIHGNVETLKPFMKCERCPQDLGCDKMEWKHMNWRLWSYHVLHSISELMRDIRGVNYLCSVGNIYCVKSYAPRVHHIVLDVCVSSV